MSTARLSAVEPEDRDGLQDELSLGLQALDHESLSLFRQGPHGRSRPTRDGLSAPPMDTVVFDLSARFHFAILYHLKEPVKAFFELDRSRIPRHQPFPIPYFAILPHFEGPVNLELKHEKQQSLAQSNKNGFDLEAAGVI